MSSTNDVELLAGRIEAALPGSGLSTRRMFGGIAFLHHERMLCCASAKGLMVRIGAQAEAEALQAPYATQCLGTGRVMPGFIVIEPPGFSSDRDLERWLSLACAYVTRLPEKIAVPPHRGGTRRVKKAPKPTRKARKR